MLRGMRRNNTGQIKTAGQMPPKPILFFIATAFTLLLFTGISHAADYYVSPTGAATWANCSGSTPLNGTSACSWQTAMANAVAGDIVYFRGGTYNPGDAPADGYTPAMNPTNSGTAGSPIVFKAYPGETSIIIDGSGPVFGAEKRSYITWDGFQSTMSENTQVGKIIEIDYSDNIIIQNCDLRGIPSLDQYNKSGIQIDWSNHVYIYNNKFSAFNGSNVNTGAIWNMSSSYVYFYNNDVYDSEKGFMTKFFPNYVYVYNNYFYNTKIAYYHLPSLGVSPGVDYFVYQNIVNSGSLVYSPDASGVNTNLNIYNNTVYNNTNGAIQIGNNIYHNTRNSKIYNNIIYTITGTPAFLMYNSTEDRPDYSDYNLFYGNGNWRWDYFTTISSLALWRTTTGFDLNSITSDPLFVNAGGTSPADYKLQASSPARTSGRGGSYATVMGAYITGNEIIGYDPDAPRVEITSPSNSTVTTTNASITLSGTATDTVGIVSVIWSNNRGGSGTAWSGTATQNVNWAIANIPLQSGQNIITVTATDGDNKTGIDVITVTVSSGGGDTGGNTGGSGGDSSASGGSGCGFVKDSGKGQKAKGEGLALIMMLIISIIGISIIRRITKISVTYSQQCQSKLSIRTLLRYCFLFCLFLWVIMAAYLPAAYSYSQTSPHWNHIRTMLTDYQTIYISDDVERAGRYDWGASHYDIVIGDGVLPGYYGNAAYEYKHRNPGLKWYAYTLNWTFMRINADFVTTAWYIHMQNWYNNHPEYNLEDAFVHDSNICPSPTPKTEACRIQIFVWDSYRWAINPADPGLQAYQAQRMKDIIAVNTMNGYEPDGIFFDEHASWDFNEAGLGPFNGHIREYTGTTDQVGAYINDIIGLLQIEKNALGPNKLIILNTNLNRRQEDLQLIIAAGSAYLESTNNPLRDGMSVRWDWVDSILSNGARASFNTYPNVADANFPPGNFASGQDRMNIGWLADFYMVIPNSPDNLAYESQSVLYNRPFESFWYEAIGVNVGSPLGPRSIYREGTDPNGRSYRIWARNFGNALVLSRPLAAWDYTTYDDTTGVTITLPTGDTYIPLYSDGTFGAPVSSITLRNAEAVILIKQGSLSPQLQFSSPTYSVSEGAGTATISVMRAGISTGAVSVDYTISNGSATAGSDYTATNGTLNWASGDTTAKSITITIINDTVIEGNETVNIALSNANGAQISGANPVVLTITDNDSAGGNTGGSGSDSSASGGSGCGFVKDDGKGQGAKGEGVALIMMLIISLIVVLVLRRATKINYI